MKRWYVVQVFAGYEARVKSDLQKRIGENEFGEKIGQILIPSVKIKSLFSGDENDEQLFPGYVLVEMELVPGAFALVTTTPRVLRFLGGRNPIPISSKEMDKIFSQIEGKVAVTKEEEAFAVGDGVEIAQGPFAGFCGKVESVNMSNKSLTVMVSILGRMTPVELRFDQIKQ